MRSSPPISKAELKLLSDINDHHPITVRDVAEHFAPAAAPGTNDPFVRPPTPSADPFVAPNSPQALPSGPTPRPTTAPKGGFNDPILLPPGPNATPAQGQATPGLRSVPFLSEIPLIGQLFRTAPVHAPIGLFY